MWHSGWPYTPTDLTPVTLVNDAGQLVARPMRSIGWLNSERLPSYRRVDARFTRYFESSHGKLSAFFEAYNLLGTRNVRGLWKQAEVNGRSVQVVVSEVDQWPRLPLAGLTWEF